MINKNPPFEINNKIVSLISDISELLGNIKAVSGLSKNPVLRRTNRIRTIYSSLAIEQNTLSLEQVTAVINGKHVLAPVKDITEVKNAYQIYENLEILNPYSIEDLLNAHEVMTQGLIEESGIFRTKNVGVADNNGAIIHIGTLPQYIPDLMQELLDWVKNSDFHPLIKGCVFHYEFELIHPFADGNGRIGRLWHTLILSKWNPVFSYIPVESIIHNHQAEYYNAINESNVQVNSTPFIEFMLFIIKEALAEAIGNSSFAADKSETREELILSFIKSNDYIYNSDVCRMFNVSIATASRILAKLYEQGKIVRIRIKSRWAYRLP